MPRRMRTDINGRNNGRSKPLLLNGEQRNFTIVDQVGLFKKIIYYKISFLKHGLSFYFCLN